jgi:hypothetical protein
LYITISVCKLLAVINIGLYFSPGITCLPGDFYENGIYFSMDKYINQDAGCLPAVICCLPTGALFYINLFRQVATQKKNTGYFKPC